MFEEIIRQIIREELTAAFQNLPQYVNQDRVLNADEVAELIGRSKSWVSSNKEKLPATVYEGSRKWRKSDILNWIEKQKEEQEKRDNITPFIKNRTVVRNMKQVKGV